ncbi:hypothetical protein NB689_001932 [Xanthomonas sacchari]|nr:hypothetical protein [Xanthomonas sacchari]
MRSPNALPSPSVCGNCSASHEVLITTSRTPSAASLRRCQTISGVPPTASSGLGVCAVNGRMRSPRPAAKISAFMRRPPRAAPGPA